MEKFKGELKISSYLDRKRVWLSTIVFENDSIVQKISKILKRKIYFLNKRISDDDLLNFNIEEAQIKNQNEALVHNRNTLKYAKPGDKFYGILESSEYPPRKVYLKFMKPGILIKSHAFDIALKSPVFDYTEEVKIEKINFKIFKKEDLSKAS